MNFYNPKEGLEKDEVGSMKMADGSIYSVKNGTIRKTEEKIYKKLSSKERRRVRKVLKEIK